MQTLESKKIEDYLHLYLGCMVVKGNEIIAYKLDAMEYYTVKEFGYWPIIKPILRQLSDMTEEERAQKDRLKNMEDNYTSAWEPLMNRAESIKYLLSKHFDLFGLIPAGLAIDKNKKDANT